MKITVECTPNEIAEFVKTFSVSKGNANNVVEEHGRQNNIVDLIVDKMREVFKNYKDYLVPNECKANTTNSLSNRKVNDMIKSNLTETMGSDTTLSTNEEKFDISLYEQNRKKRIELLQKQMELLSKASEETIDPEALTTLTKTMISICRYFYDDQIMHNKG